MTTHVSVRSSKRHTVAVSGRPSNLPLPQDIGILLLCLTLGAIMIAHGTQKLLGWFGGRGLDGTAAFFEASGYPAAKPMAVVAALSETGGGVALVLGLLTPLAGAAGLGTMINAIGFRWGGGFSAPAGFEFELLLATAAAALCLMGAGGIALDRAIPPLRQHRLSYGAAAVLLGVMTATILLILRA